MITSLHITRRHDRRRETVSLGAASRHRVFLAAVFGFALTAFPLGGQELTPPRITAPAPTAEAPEGHYLVTWEGTGSVSGDTRYQLQYASGDAFDAPITVDAGLDLASFLSGLPAGTTYVRVRALGPGQQSAWSATGSIIVIYPEPAVVQRLMLLGLATFLVLIVVVVVGHARTRDSSIKAGTPA